jgi:anti-sigma B factor antagonist
MSTSLTIALRNEVLTATIAGNIDGQTAPALQAQLLDALSPVTAAVFEVSQVPYMSSAGFRMLLLAYRSLAIRNGRLALAGLSEEIRDTMAMTGFLDFFLLCNSLDEALEQVRNDSTQHAATR